MKVRPVIVIVETEETEETEVEVTAVTAVVLLNAVVMTHLPPVNPVKMITM